MMSMIGKMVSILRVLESLTCINNFFLSIAFSCIMNTFGSLSVAIE